MIIKICGFTRRKDIEDALKLGIDLIGVNFYYKSPRYIAPEEAKKLLKDINGTIVGVFVNPEEKYLLQVVSELNLSGIQLHGEEPLSLLNLIKKKFPGRIIIKGIRVKDRENLKNMIDKYSGVDFYLLDAYDEFKEGGTGKTISSSLLESDFIPWRKTFLAGGITPDNVKEIISSFHPYGIDVASGVESAAGIKDRGKMEALVKNVGR